MHLVPACDLFVCAGEPSGDAYAAAVVRELRRRRSDLIVAGMGGERLAAEGVEIEQDIDGLAVMGFLPVLARLPRFLRLGWSLAATIRARRPKVILTVDYPGFNLRLLRRLAPLRREGVRFVHLVAPQVWAWKPRRAKSIAQTIDRLLCFFPFEPPLFERFRASGGGAADFVGHPLLDLLTPPPDPAAIRAELGLAPGDRLILVAPGSRAREVGPLVGLLNRAAEAAAQRCAGRQPGRIRIAVSRVGDLDRDLYREAGAPLIEGRYRELCAAAHVALIASGTASLEAALIGLPHIISYRTDPVQARLVHHLIRTDHVGLPNIVAGRRVCPEVLQDQLDLPRLVAHLCRLWDGDGRATCLAGLTEVRQRLGAGGALSRIADAVGAELDHVAEQRRKAGRSSDSIRLKTAGDSTG